MSPPPYEFYVDKIIHAGIEHIPYCISNNLSLVKDIKLFNSFYKQYKKVSPDIIVHYTIKPNIYGSIAAYLAHIPSISVVPGTGSVFKDKGILSRAVIFLYKMTFHCPKKIWVLNRDDYNSFLNKRITKKSKLDILPGEGVDTNYFNTTIEYKKHSPFVFLYMGRMLREKGVEILAQASKKLHSKNVHNFEIHLLGLTDGHSKDVISMDEIHTWESEGLVRYLGSAPDVRKNIENADCIVLPSFYGEGVPRSLMEGCSMRRVALTTKNVGCRDVVEDNYNGLLCEPQNVDDLAEKMELIMSFDEEKLRIMGDNGRLKVIKLFNEDVVIQRYLGEITKFI